MRNNAPPIHDYVRIINFLLLIIINIQHVYRVYIVSARNK